MKTIQTFDKIAQMGKRVRVVQGGTSAGKTYSILQLLVVLCLKSEKSLLVSVVSESIPHLKRGAMRDLQNILMEDNLYSEKMHNKSDNSFKIGKSVIEFFGADQPDKLRGARRDVLFINECNNVNYEAYNQLEVRTKKVIYLDYNPTTEFWVHDEVLKQSDASYVKVTYKDNELLDQTIVKSIEKRKPRYDASGELVSGNENWWRVYGLGETGVYEGLVYKNFEIVDKVPEGARFVAYGLDFGYSNDPASFDAIYDYDGKVLIDNIIYETGLTNVFMNEEDRQKSLVGKFMDMKIDKNAKIIADSAEPKSIEEIFRAGYNIHGARKGKDSISYGIDQVNSRGLLITKQSVGTIKEVRNYIWDTDKNGKQLDRPIDDWNHSLDSMRYVVINELAGQWENQARKNNLIGERDESFEERLGIPASSPVGTNQFCNF